MRVFLRGLEDPFVLCTVFRGNYGFGGGTGDQGNLGFLHNRDNRQGTTAPRRTDDRTDIIAVDQLLYGVDRLGSVSHCIFNDQLQGMPIDPTLLVDLFFDHQGGIPLRLTKPGSRSGNREDRSYLVWLRFIASDAG